MRCRCRNATKMGCMTCRANRTADQKQIQSKRQARISNQSKQGVGRPWAWCPTLDAREAVSNTGQRDSKANRHTEDKQNIETRIQATVSRHRLNMQAQDTKETKKLTICNMCQA